MKKREQRIARLRMVLGEFLTASIAASILDQQLQLDPSSLAKHELRRTDFRRFRSHLEPTYFIRLFAEFESTLRDLWNSIGKETQPPASHLIDGLASRYRLRPGVRELAQKIKTYRNSLVHEESTDAEQIAFGEATQTLLRFLSFMPANW